MRPHYMPVARALSTTTVAVLLAACAPEATLTPDAAGQPSMAQGAVVSMAMDAGHSGLAAVRAATARYHRVEVAIADGYVGAPVCASSPAGAMGIHYINNALRSDATFDPSRPEILVYEPEANGKLRLVAVEYFIWRALWDAANPGGAGPEFLGNPFFHSFGPAAHGERDHYELHVWLWRHNPSGMFAQWNPDVTCAHAP